MKLLEVSHIPKVCVENPVSSLVYEMPPHTQTIQPWQYGHPFTKATRLWLRNLPALEPTNVVDKAQSTKIPGNWFNKGGLDRQKNRAKFFQGWADAMADQWGYSGVSYIFVLFAFLLSFSYFHFLKNKVISLEDVLCSKERFNPVVCIIRANDGILLIICKCRLGVFI